MPFIIWSIIISENGIVYGVLKAIRKFVFVGSYTHLWYLLAAAIATLIVSWVIKKRIEKQAIVLGILVLYVISLLGLPYHELVRLLESVPLVCETIRLYELVFVTTRNGFFYGTIFVGMGALFAYRKICISQSTAIVGFVISMLFMFAEAFCVRNFELAKSTEFYFFMPPAIFFLFYIATHIEIKETKTTIALRKYSSIIYFIHLWVYCVFQKLDLLLNLKINSMLLYTMVALGSLSLAMIIVELQKHKSFMWLKNIV